MRYQNKLTRISAHFSASLLCAAVSSAILLQATAHAEDWPAWRGPACDGISKETGWLQKWPEAGLKKLWEGNVGIGFSSFSVSKGKLYTMGNIQEMDYIFCFDAETGKELWKHSYACSSKDPNGYPGTRATPTVDGNRVYSISRNGHFFCLDADSGKVVWSKDLVKDFGGVIPRWGYAGSPCIEKDWVLLETGAKGASVVAFDKKTGEVVWKNGSDGAGYATIIAYDNGGERCFAQFSTDQIIGRRMKDGSELWRSSWKTSYGVNAATPIIIGDEMFLSSGYGFGCALLKISPTEAKEVWRNKNMRNHVNSCVVINGNIYGYDDNSLKCLDYKTGEVKWSNNSYGKGALMAADGKLILYSDKAKLGLAEPSPDAFKEICNFQAIPFDGGKETWASPLLANGRIYVRNMGKLVAYDAKGN